MNNEKKIWEDFESSQQQNLGSRVVFQHDIVQKYTLAFWSAHSPDLNPILRSELKTKNHARRWSNLEKFKRFANEEWSRTAQVVHVRLVENYNKGLLTVIQQKGFSTQLLATEGLIMLTLAYFSCCKIIFNT